MTTITLTFNPPTPVPDADTDVLAGVLRDDGSIEVWEAHFEHGTWWSSNATMITSPVVSWAHKPAGVDLRKGLALAAPAPAVPSDALSLPKYRAWLHVKEHGEWPKGIDRAWMKDDMGRHNDSVVAREVIQELAAALTPPAQPAVPSDPTQQVRPYEPTEPMRWAMKRIDPALTHDQCRALWSAAWTAAPTPPAQSGIRAEFVDAHIQRTAQTVGSMVAETADQRGADAVAEFVRRAMQHVVSLIDATPPAQPKCLTCNGHGLIGGHMQDGSGYAEGCPDCNPEPAAPEDVARDAERYRWLREQEWFSGPLCVLRDPKRVLTRGIGLGADCPSGGRLDAAIDTARAAEKGGA